MLRCQACDSEFPRFVVIDGKRRDLRGRHRCVNCRPFRSLRKPRRPVIRGLRLLKCQACQREFPAKVVIEGKLRSLYRRRFCLECSPFGRHNTSKFPFGQTLDLAAERRRRRTESFRRSLRKRRRERKAALITAQGGACVDCGYAACIEAFQFHHLDPETKSLTLANFSGSWDRLKAEAAKCVLLCATCHRLRHIRDETGGRPAELRREKKRRAVECFGDVCFGCNRRYPATVFEFHHLDARTKDFEIATGGMGRSWAQIVSELAKCVMLCANCHCEVHAGLRQLSGTGVRPELTISEGAVSGAA